MKAELLFFLIAVVFILFFQACQVNNLNGSDVSPHQEITGIENQTEAVLRHTKTVKGKTSDSTCTATSNDLNRKETPIPTPTSKLSYYEWLKSVRILVYDDSYGSVDTYGMPVANDVIMDAIKRLSLDHQTVNVKDATGKFLENLNSSQSWDLIIGATEFREDLQGDIWQQIERRMEEKKSALILKIWYLDGINMGEINSLMEHCGVQFQKNLEKVEGSNPNDYLIYYLDEEHPVFQEPNEIGDERGFLIPVPPPRIWVEPQIYRGTVVVEGSYQIPTRMPFVWVDDVGDLIEITNPSKATLLAGTHRDLKESYGVITSCYEGRMIMQNFRNIDYKDEDVIGLWQNYILYTLNNRYLTIP